MSVETGVEKGEKDKVLGTKISAGVKQTTNDDEML